MVERRKFPRVEFTRGVLWRNTDSLDNLDIANDISEGGIGITTNTAALRPNDLVQLEFQLPTTKTIHTKAQVKWVAPNDLRRDTWRAGLQFIDISDVKRHEICCFVGKCRYACD